MNYQFENLSPDLFQELAQALLLKLHPDLQCYPVGQPDGGRDGAVWQQLHNRNRGSGFLLFQVKFARFPNEIRDAAAWVRAVIQEEIPKISEQMRRGARQYILITNVRGTAALDVGEMDRVQVYMSSEIGIPSQCWWRDDVARRLDGEWDIKWAFPALLTGTDILRALVESGLTEHAQRRTSALRAMVMSQYVNERSVKFKQVELQNNLIDLFVDTPLLQPMIEEGKGRTHDRHLVHLHAVLSRARLETNPHSIRRIREGRDNPNVGTATFFLNAHVQALASRAVLEGAPGQGKSTITQYVCQVHRIRILEKEVELAKLPLAHRSCPVRLPIRIDLRDFSSWMNGIDPFAPDSQTMLAPSLARTLETFLSSFIYHASGGVQFDVADLHAALRITSLLLVFDGLDEVADIRGRGDVVAELNSGIQRLMSLAASLQVLITSRPAAFANAPGMPRESFPHFSLSLLGLTEVEEYAKKWSAGKSLADRESRDLMKVLELKMSQPHLRDLARNPMQLAILLSLMHSRGVSLPDKRTALYDTYVEVFFTREAEKSAIVAEFRDVLVNLHGHVAWILHSQAETGGTGRISTEHLHFVIDEYLKAEGYEPALSDRLFHGVVERVVALVQRAQGAYEFEVQPLREYFAARHLYNTAPYSPTGNEQPGSKPARFAAIARNPYWLNVTRFYAGCYSSGELASLIYGLKDLRDEDAYAGLSYPRTLAATLLGDWVFSQTPRLIRDVMNIMFDAPGLAHVAAAAASERSEGVSFANPHARSELVSRCWAALRGDVAQDYVFRLCDLIRANSERPETASRWLEGVADPAMRTRMLSVGLALGHLAALDTGDVANVARPVLADVALLWRARQEAFLESVHEYREVALDLVLDGRAPMRRSSRRNALNKISNSLDFVMISFAMRDGGPIPLAERLRNQYRYSAATADGGDDAAPESCGELQAKADRLWEFAESALGRTCDEWATTLGPWEQVVENARHVFGDRWVLKMMAAVAAGIRSADERGEGADDLFDVNASLCRRARYARLRAGVESFWVRCLDARGEDGKYALLLVLVWASERTIARLSSRLSAALDALAQSEWEHLFDSVEIVSRCVQKNWPSQSAGSGVDTGVSMRLAAVLSLRGVSLKRKAELYSAAIGNLAIDDSRILRAFLQVAEERMFIGVLEPVELAFVRRAYRGAHLPERASHVQTVSMPRVVAQQVCRSPSEYPRSFFVSAERQESERMSTSIVPVATIAHRDGWFA